MTLRYGRVHIIRNRLLFKGEKVDMMPFGLKIAIINRAFCKKLDEKASLMGLTAVQLRVLGSISRLEESGRSEIHQNDLEEIEHVTHPAMTKLLSRLEAKGFVECAPSSADRRYKKISCTGKSRGIHRTILGQDEEVLCELCRGLSEDDRMLLQTLTDAIVCNIDMEKS